VLSELEMILQLRYVHYPLMSNGTKMLVWSNMTSYQKRLIKKLLKRARVAPSWFSKYRYMTITICNKIALVRTFTPMAVLGLWPPDYCGYVDSQLMFTIYTAMTRLLSISVNLTFSKTIHANMKYEIWCSGKF